MNRFESELTKGNFVTSECTNCMEIVWPPSNFCNKCFGDVTWREVQKKAKLIDFSKKNGESFCVAEFENKIRILSTLKSSDTEPKLGQDLILENCGFKNGNYDFTLSLT